MRIIHPSRWTTGMTRNREIGVAIQVWQHRGLEMESHMRLLAGVLVFVILCSGTGIAANAVAEGEQWLKWSDETKLEYVSAYIVGFDSGVFRACKRRE